MQRVLIGAVNAQAEASVVWSAKESGIIRTRGGNIENALQA